LAIFRLRRETKQISLITEVTEKTQKCLTLAVKALIVRMCMLQTLKKQDCNRISEQIRVCVFCSNVASVPAAGNK